MYNCFIGLIKVQLQFQLHSRIAEKQLAEETALSETQREHNSTCLCCFQLQVFSPRTWSQHKVMWAWDWDFYLFHRKRTDNWLARSSKWVFYGLMGVLQAFSSLWCLVCLSIYVHSTKEGTAPSPDHRKEEKAYSTWYFCFLFFVFIKSLKSASVSPWRRHLYKIHFIICF